LSYQALYNISHVTCTQIQRPIKYIFYEKSTTTPEHKHAKQKVKAQINDKTNKHVKFENS